MHRNLFFLKFMLLWQAYENRLKFFITYILSNTRFLIIAKRLAFISYPYRTVPARMIGRAGVRAGGVGKRWISRFYIGTSVWQRLFYTSTLRQTQGRLSSAQAPRLIIDTNENPSMKNSGPVLRSKIAYLHNKIA